jgi:hypothetical protein
LGPWTISVHQKLTHNTSKWTAINLVVPKYRAIHDPYDTKSTSTQSSNASHSDAQFRRIKDIHHTKKFTTVSDK